jgi:hypothetical protein
MADDAARRLASVVPAFECRYDSGRAELAFDLKLDLPPPPSLPRSQVTCSLLIGGRAGRQHAGRWHPGLPGTGTYNKVTMTLSAEPAGRPGADQGPRAAAGAARGLGRAARSDLWEEFQLTPEQSTDALIAHHPEAKYFST